MKILVKQQQGMTLIEVVVSMLIIGLGLVMCMSMLQTSLRYQSTSIEQNAAVHLMQDMISRMRMNAKFAEQYTFSNNTSNVNCSDSEDGCAQAKTDVESWIKSLKRALPDGSAEIANAGNHQYKITVQWTNNEDSNRLEIIGKQATDDSLKHSLAINFAL